MIPYVTHRFIFGVQTYMILYFTGWIVAFAFARRLAKLNNINIGKIDYSLLLILVMAPLFGRILFFMGPWGGWLNFRDFINIFHDGYIFYGMLLGGYLASLIMKKRLKAGDKIYDIFAFVPPIGMFIGRIGCFFAGCCYGLKTKSFYALEYLGQGFARYPTQTLSSLLHLIILVTLLKVRERKRFDGQLGLLFLIMYSIGRFMIDFLKEDMRFFGFTPTQYISVVILIIGGWAYYAALSKINNR